MIGAACESDTDCRTGDCTGGVCAPTASCAALHQHNASLPNGEYVINPPGGTGFPAYCDMTDKGGGWTLVLKMGSTASPGTFAYDASLWTVPESLNATSTNMGEVEAEFPSYARVPVTNGVLAMMAPLGLADATPTTVNMLVLSLTDSTSLEHLISTSAQNSVGLDAGRAGWLSLPVPDAALQENCNAQGVNVSGSNKADACGGPADGVSIRLGIIANDQDDCCSPNSYIGFGGANLGDQNCTPAEYSAGNVTGYPTTTGCGGITTMNVADFGYLFVK
jgi:hypothetical protein